MVHAALVARPERSTQCVKDKIQDQHRSTPCIAFSNIITLSIIMRGMQHAP